jgi:DNA repair protein RadC
MADATLEKHRPDLRERARAFGVDSFRDDELFALLLERGVEGEGVEARARRLLERAGGVRGLASRGVGGLAADLGLGLAGASRIAAALELGARVARWERPGTPTTCAADVARWARARLLGLPHEELWALLLDARNVVVAERLVARGGVHALALTAADALRPAVREGASAFVLVHNHPAGDPCPSPEDLSFSLRTSAAAVAVGVSFVDHVIVGRHGHVSLLESGLLHGEP